MLSDLLSTVAEGGKILLEEEEYLLARVEIEGRAMLAEVSTGDAGGIPASEWPMVSGVIHPDSEISPTSEAGSRILLFSVPQGSELYLERIMRDGALPESGALDVGRKMLAILRRLHDAGFRAGYLGPENVLVTPAGDHYILGGARGIPDTPFAPPEAVGIRAQDPRSDVYALGLLMFRLIAGSDNRNVQIDAWNRLSEGVMKLLERMVTPEADDRYANLMVLSRKMAAVAPRRSSPESEQYAGDGSVSSGGRLPLWVWFLMIAAVAGTALVVISPWNDGNGSGEPSRVPAAPVQTDTSVTVEQPDTIPEAIPDQAEQWEPIIWISNGTGQPGLASEFRQGPVAGYSGVYACTGSRRGSSILLARRSDPTLPLSEQQDLYRTSLELASSDSSLSVFPVDITMFLGADLMDDTVSPGIIIPSESPAGTLYVDIANHGVTGSFGGTGAATWVRSVLDGRSIMLEGSEWAVEVVDFRDGDMMNQELGIPGELGATGFLYHEGIPLLQEAESQLRQVFLSTSTHVPPDLPSPPDIWILLGR